ncbi:glycosyltransferase family 39 protein [Microbulbifer sp. SAOS-129_SWC]|uniref:glycosyltransferase family 39 protein n=1 Tax=Microbulbifer sp. SAOS-129_SWC TaxID=3145235 RepID=UPI003217ECC4
MDTGYLSADRIPDVKESSTSRTNLFYVCVALLLIIWFSGLGHRDLVEPDEGRYAEIPREMVSSGDWTTPRLNDLKYFEKPALQYWLTAASYEVFGYSNASARLWIALASFACAAFMGFLGLRLYGRDVGRYSFLLTASTVLFAGAGHYLTLDMTLTLFMTLGVGCPILAMRPGISPQAKRNWMLAGWAALAFAVLSKGLIGVVLPGAALVGYLLWQRDWKLIQDLHPVKGILLFLLVCAPWFIEVSRQNPEFFHFFFIREHFERYTTNVHHREGPVYYFLGVFIIGVLPWLVTSAKSVLFPRFSWGSSKENGFDTEKFIWLYIAITFIFFSLGHSKLPAYILPIFPFVALLAAKRLSVDKVVKGDAWVMLVTAVLAFVLAMLGPHFASEKNPAALFIAYRPWLIGAALSLGLGAFALLKWKRKPSTAIPVASVCATLCTMLFLWGFQSIAVSRSSADEAKAIMSYADDSTPIYAIDNYPQALPFYLERPITLVSYTGELKMGIEAEPQKYIATKAEFWKKWNTQRQAVAVIRADEKEDFLAKGKDTEIIYEGPRRIVMAKQLK